MGTLFFLFISNGLANEVREKQVYGHAKIVSTRIEHSVGTFGHPYQGRRSDGEHDGPHPE